MRRPAAGLDLFGLVYGDVGDRVGGAWADGCGERCGEEVAGGIVEGEEVWLIRPAILP